MRANTSDGSNGEPSTEYPEISNFADEANSCANVGNASVNPATAHPTVATNPTPPNFLDALMADFRNNLANSPAFHYKPRA